MPAAAITLAQRMQEAGYRTAGFSNNPLIGILNNGMKRGFDRFITYGGLLSANPGARNSNGHANNRGLQQAQLLIAQLMNKVQVRLANAGDWRHFWFSKGIVPFWQLALKIRGNLKGNTPQTLADVQRFFAERKSAANSRPAFAFVNLMGTHMPYAPPKWAQNLMGSSTHYKLPFQWRFNANIHHSLGPLAAPYPAKESAILNDLYNAEVHFQDYLLGQFLTRFREAGQLEKTLVIITSDHGEHLGEKLLLGHGFGAYHILAHVPLIIRGPQCGFPVSETRESFVSTRRIFHTILAAAGAGSESEAALSLVQESEDNVVFMEASPSKSAVRLIEKRRPGIIAERGFQDTHFAIYKGNHKVYIAGRSKADIYAVRDDPMEEAELGVEREEEMVKIISSFHRTVSRQDEAGASDGEGLIADQVLRDRLRHLGYL